MAAPAPAPAPAPSSISILTYNLWFREDVQLEGRMRAVGDIIAQHEPDVLCFQEVTATIYTMLRRMSWWGRYECSISQAQIDRSYFIMQLSRLAVSSFQRHPFHNSIMSRELCVAFLNTRPSPPHPHPHPHPDPARTTATTTATSGSRGVSHSTITSSGGGGGGLVVASSHLESPCPAPPTFDQMFSPQRVAQAREAFERLAGHGDAVFCGDLNWDEKTDGPPPLPSGWCDAWEQLRPGQAGLTYDCSANPMLAGGEPRKRVDRLFCRLESYELQDIQMVGTEAIPGLTYQKETRVDNAPTTVTLPVLPSDHFGLLLRIRPK